MATIVNFVRWADNTPDLIRNLSQGLDQVEALTAASDKMAKTLGGEKLLQSANNLTAAIMKIGGTQKLTSAEQERANALLDKAIEKYQALGMTAPSAMVALRNSMQGANAAVDTLQSKASDLAGKLTQAFHDPVGAAKELASTLVTDVAEGGMAAIAIGAAGVVTAVGAMGAAAAEAVSHFVSMGEEILDASYKMSETVEKTAALKGAMDVAGGSIDQAADLVFKLQQRLESSGPDADKVAQGLQKIGLSIEEIQQLSPAEQLLKISAAFRENTNETNRAGVAFDLWGRQGRDAIPLIMKPLSELNDEWKKNGAMTAEDAKAAEDLAIAWRGLKESLSWAVTGVGASIVHWFQEVNAEMRAYKDLYEFFASHTPAGAQPVPKFGEYYGQTPSDIGLGNQAPALPKAPALTMPELPAQYTEKPIAVLAPGSAEYLKAAEQAMDLQLKTVPALAAAQAKLTEEMNKYRDALLGIAPVETAHQAILTQIIQMGPLEVDVHERVVKALADMIAKHEQLTPVLKAWYDQNHEIIDQLKEMPGAMQAAFQPGLIEDLGSVQIPLINSGFGETAKSLYGAALATKEWNDKQDAVNAALHEGAANVDTLDRNLTKALQGIPQLFINAFTGGGGVLGALKGIGVSLLDAITKDIFDPIMKSLAGWLSGFTKKLTQGLSQAAGSSVASTLIGSSASGAMLGGAALGGAGTTTFGSGVAGTTIGEGAAAGGGGGAAASLGLTAASYAPLVYVGYLMVSTWLKAKAAIKEARTEQATMITDLQAMATPEQKAAGALIDNYHTIAIVGRDAFLQVGESAQVADNWVAALLNTSNPAAFKAAQQHLADIVAWEAKVKTGIDDVATAFGAAGEYIPKALRESVTTLAAMPGLTDAERQSLLKLVSDATPTFNDLMGVAGKYGLTLGDLGGAVQQLGTESMSKTLFNDFTELTDAGAGASIVAKAMSKDLNTLVDDSLKYGTKIPENMKPVLQSLSDQGLLFDNNGTKITDLSGLSFEQTPLDKSLSDLTTAIQHLIDTLKQVPGAIDAINNHPINIPIAPSPLNPGPGAGSNYGPGGGGYVPSGPTSGDGGGFDDGSHGLTGSASTGGLVTMYGIQHFANGGRVLRFLPRGTDTVPAMLTPGELILNRAQQAHVGALLDMNRLAVNGLGAETTRALNSNGGQLGSAPAPSQPEPPRQPVVVQFVLGNTVIAEQMIDDILHDRKGIRRVLKRAAA